MRKLVTDTELSIIHPPRMLWRIFGTPFLLGGVFLEYEALTAWQSNSSATPLFDHLIVMLLPLVSVFVGIVCWLGFSGYSINKAGTKYTSWWGIFRPCQKTVKSLHKVHSVHITKEHRQVRNHYGRYYDDTFYSVRLGGRYGTEFDAYAFETDAREIATAIAAFLACDLIDDITGHATALPADGETASDESSK